MHKYFAKTLFLGKKVEFLPECHSTNAEMLSRQKTQTLPEGYVIWTDHQIAGRGQRGNIWISEPGKNLLFSLFIKPRKLLPQYAYLINIAAGLAVVDTLRSMSLEVELKWPNDVYVSDLKLAGILVETTIDSGFIGGAVIGVGLNVNQSHFPLATATSLKIETNSDLDREQLLERLIQSFEKYYLLIRADQTSRLLADYYEVMRWRGELHTFKSGDEVFEGEIIGIDNTGRLQLRVHDAMRKFDVKEIIFSH